MQAWIIKVTFLKNNVINFNEGYQTYSECINAIKKKINYEDMKIINDYIIRDIENEIEYETKLVTIF